MLVRQFGLLRRLVDIIYGHWFKCGMILGLGVRGVPGVGFWVALDNCLGIGLVEFLFVLWVLRVVVYAWWGFDMGLGVVF